MIFSLLLLLQSAASAQGPQMTAPIAQNSVGQLHEQFIESSDEAEKAKILSRLTRTPPESAREVQALFDLFMRFPQTDVRDAALNSLALTEFQDPSLDVLFV